MPQQRGSHFEWDPEILEPRREGVTEIVEMEIGHFRLGAQSSPERAEGRRIPSSEDFPIHMNEIASQCLIGGRSEGNFTGCLLQPAARRREDQPPAIIALAQPGPINL
ncbi:MAG TPA: hypothetical protein VGQ08_11750 [Nitrospiraceae bacterium]|nr:hypothetical protein [Nitrospiraceae bacterium]